MKFCELISPKRADGEESRKRIIMTALKLFAEHGYARTSTRQIAKEANVNVSAIAYYFGDKAGLYRVVFTEPLGTPADDIGLFSDEHLTLEQALAGLFQGFIEPLKQGDLAQLCIRLHMREMVEPTGLWEEEIHNSIAPYHQALLVVLQRHLKVTKTDDDLHRLAFSIVAMGVHLYAGRDVIARISPQLTDTHEALDVLKDRLVMFAVSMVNAEANRRKLITSAKH
ncbi:MAG TPA: CerR family C-terminal domain-containing protein [Methylotenera sp.]|nr:CerR family C-terminal domain-containing protein [Methylotenera sp.]